MRLLINRLFVIILVVILFILPSLFLTSCFYSNALYQKNTTLESESDGLVYVSENLLLQEDEISSDRAEQYKNNHEYLPQMSYNNNKDLSLVTISDAAEEKETEQLLITNLFFALDSNNNTFIMSKTMEISIAVCGNYTLEDNKLTLIPGGTKSADGYLYTFLCNDDDTVEFCKEYSSEIPGYGIDDKTLFSPIIEKENTSFYAMQPK